MHEAEIPYGALQGLLKSLVLMAHVSVKRCWQRYRANSLTAAVQVFGVQLLPLEAPKIVG